MERVPRLPGGDRAAGLLLWVVITAPLLLPDDDAYAPAGLPLRWVKAAAVLLLGLAVLVSRRQPVAAAAVPAALGLAVSPEMHTSSFAIAQAALAFLLGRRLDRRPGMWFFTAVCAAGAVLLLVSSDTDAGDGVTLVANVLLVLVLPWLAGQYLRQRAALDRSGWELAEQLAAQQQLVSDQARMRERARIAQDMHDSLGHDLALIAVRASALQLAGDVGPAGRRSAAELRAAAATANGRLREVIGVLREDGEGAPTRPATESVASLVRSAAASGVPVTLDDRLTPAAGAEGAPALPPMTDRAVRRVVQEALTNATKHAQGAPVTVTLSRDGAQAVVTVANTAPPAAGSPASGPADTGRGYGLIGLDERVRQAGGTLHAGPAGGRFTVTARLPLAAGAPAMPPGASSISGRRAAARHTAHRTMIQTIWLPTAAVAVLLLLMIFNGDDGPGGRVLDRQVYGQLRIGEDQRAVRDRLPARQATPARDAVPADPPGTDECAFYRADADDSARLFRLCFTDGRLSHKDMVAVDD